MHVFAANDAKSKPLTTQKIIPVTNGFLLCAGQSLKLYDAKLNGCLKKCLHCLICYNFAAEKDTEEVKGTYESAKKNININKYNYKYIYIYNTYVCCDTCDGVFGNCSLLRVIRLLHEI